VRGETSDERLANRGDYIPMMANRAVRILRERRGSAARA